MARHHPLSILCMGAGLCVGLWSLGAQAQVVRCQDARTGQVTYTDGQCNSTDKAREVEARKTPEEIRQEREQAAEALERKQQRLEMEKTRQEAEAARLQAERQQKLLAQPPKMDYAQTPQCQASRRRWQDLNDAQAREPLVLQPGLDAAQRQMDMDCLGPAGYADMERYRAQRPQIVVVPQARPHPPAPPPRPRLTHCSDFQCFDDQGKGYPRAGPGRLPGPDGTCRSAGGRAPC